MGRVICGNANKSWEWEACQHASQQRTELTHSEDKLRVEIGIEVVNACDCGVSAIPRRCICAAVSSSPAARSASHRVD